jgi:mRNA interferase RelE/StbE
MRIRFSKQALKYLRKMPKNRAEDLQSALEQIADGSQAYGGDLIRLSNSRYFRLRVGGYRAILDILDDELILLVLKIGARGDVYK